MFDTKQITKIFALLSLSICLVICSGCKDKALSLYPGATVFTREDFQKRVSLKGEPLHLDSLWDARDIYIQDSILLVTSRKYEALLRLFNVKDGHKTGEYIYIGRGPDELLSLTDFQFVGDYIWAIDMPQQKYLKYTKREPLSDSFKRSVAGFSLGGNGLLFLAIPHVIDSSRVIGLNWLPNDRFITAYNFEKEEIDTTFFIPYPVDINEPNNVKIKIFEYRVTSDINRIYLAYTETDLFDIYARDGTLNNRLFGPDHFRSAYHIVEFGRVAPIAGKLFRAYVCPVITNDGLMLLYSGRPSGRYLPNADLCDELFLFSSSGEPLIEFSLDTPILTFCVDDSIKRIYGLTDTPDYQVFYFDYGSSLED